MSAFKLNTLKKKLWAIVAASFVARVIVFFTLPNTPLSLAPDEGTYANVALATFSGTISQESEYYRFVYQISKSLVMPAQPLLLVGFSAIDAVRIVSSMYGLLGLIFVVIATLKFFLKQESISHASKFNKTTATVLVTIFAFLPSHFIWSTLGLREAANEFWVICTFLLTYLLLFSSGKYPWHLAAMMFLSIVFVYCARPQVGWLVVLTLGLYSLFVIRSTKVFFFIPIVLSGMLLGYFLTSTAEISAIRNPGTVVLDQAESITLREATNQLGTAIRNPGTVVLDQAESITLKQVANQLGAASVIRTINCPFEGESQATEIICLIWRAPYMTTTFLFRPVVGVDISSNSSLLAALENLIWTFGILLIVFQMIKKRKLLKLRHLLPSIIFFVLYTVGAGSYEGNMGTAFRHKSLVLWVVLLLLFAILWRDDAKHKLKRRYISRESTV